MGLAGAMAGPGQHMDARAFSGNYTSEQTGQGVLETGVPNNGVQIRSCAATPRGKKKGRLCTCNARPLWVAVNVAVPYEEERNMCDVSALLPLQTQVRVQIIHV